MKKVRYWRLFVFVFGLFFLLLSGSHAFAAAPVSDSFDLPFGYFGWNVYGGSVGPFTQVSSGCISGQCLQSTVLFQIPRIYKTGTPLTEGNITFYAKAQSGWAQFGYGSIVLLCTGAPNVSASTNCEFRNRFTPLDGQWHQYLFAWRDHVGAKETCFQQDDVDVGHCSWVGAVAHAAGDFIDTVALSAEFGARPDLGDLLMYDELGTSNINTQSNSNVLFLPGIEASRLYRPADGGGEDRLWEPFSNADARDLFMNPDGSSVRGDIYTKIGDVIDELPTGANIYKSFIGEMDQLKTAGTIKDWLPAAYDWRLSLDDILKYGHQVGDHIYYSGNLRSTTTPYILQELRRLAGTSNTGKVTIIAHSNGGLLAKRLMEILGPEASSLIDKIIFVAVPQTGTPIAVGALLDGTNQSHALGFVLSEATARAFAQNSPMVYNLLPSRAYFDGPGSDVITPPISFRSGSTTKIFTDAYGSNINTFNELASFVSGIEGRTGPSFSNVTYPLVGNALLLNDADVLHSHLDTWVPPSGIQLYQIAGWGNETVGNISYRNGGFYHCLRYNPCLDEDLGIVVDGDGTVVTPSALTMSTSSPNVSRYWVDLNQFNKDNRLTIPLGRDHADILEVGQLNDLIDGIIINSAAQLPQYISKEVPSHLIQKRLRYFLHSPLSIEINDKNGNHLKLATSTRILENTIPGATYTEFGDIKYVSVPAEDLPTLRLEGESAGGFTLKIEEVEGNSILATTTFADIPSATTTIATMNFSDGTIAGASPLSLDVNGDGTTVYSLTPKLDGLVVFNPLTVTVDNKTIVLGSPIPSFTVSFSGFVNGDDAAHNDIAGVPQCSTTATATTGIGIYPIICTIGTLTSSTYQFTSFIVGTLTITYRWSGFLQPINDPSINPTQSLSVFKGGSTVPVKFQLKKVNGMLAQAGKNPVWLTPIKGSTLTAAIDESTYSDPSTSGGEFRWDSAPGQYIYNWNTKGVTPGYWYKVSAQLDDGKTYSVTVGLR